MVNPNLQQILNAHPDLDLSKKIKELSVDLDKVQELKYFASTEAGKIILQALRTSSSSALQKALVASIENNGADAVAHLNRLSSYLVATSEFADLDDREHDLQTILDEEIKSLLGA